VPSRFLEEVPGGLIEELGTRRSGAPLHRTAEGGRPHTSYYDSGSSHYSYEDEDQSAAWHARDGDRKDSRAVKQTVAARAYNSIENIAEFFSTRGKKFSVPKSPVVEEPTGKRGFRPGQRVRHPKYGEGTVYQREGEGEEAKITVQFPRFGLKKLVEKYAQLEKA
jgi:DNA helicase II / ATP-dependent DNA helicase PcrA